MNQFRILKPEEAARRAKEKVREFKAAKEMEAVRVVQTIPGESARGRAPLTNMNPKHCRHGIVGEPGLTPGKSQEILNGMLLDAVKGDDAQQVERLLRAGADANAKDPSGETALMKAAINGKGWAIILLRGYHADLKAVDNFGRNARMHAEMNGHEDIAKLLEAFGAK